MCLGGGINPIDEAQQPASVPTIVFLSSGKRTCPMMLQAEFAKINFVWFTASPVGSPKTGRSGKKRPFSRSVKTQQAR